VNGAHDSGIRRFWQRIFLHICRYGDVFI